MPIIITGIDVRRFVIAINPISGTKDKEQLMQRLAERCGQAAIPFEFLFTNPEGNYPGLLQQVQNGEVTDVVVCGGDGTINQIAGSLLGMDIPIGIIPMGSGNGLALSAGISKDPDEAMDIIIKGRSQWVDGFFINDRFSCMLCGLGFDAQVAHEFAKEKKRGLNTYIKQTIQQFTTAPSYNFTLHINDTEINTDAFFISIANSNQFCLLYTSPSPRD